MIGHQCDIPSDTPLPLGVMPGHPHLPFQACGCPNVVEQTTSILTYHAQQRPTGPARWNLLRRVTKPVAVVRGGTRTGCLGLTV